MRYTGWSKKVSHLQRRIQDLTRRVDRGERADREPERGSQGGAPSGGPGAQKPPQAENFLSIFIQNEAKS